MNGSRNPPTQASVWNGTPRDEAMAASSGIGSITPCGFTHRLSGDFSGAITNLSSDCPNTLPAKKAQVRAIAAEPGAYYVNVHNGAHPAGAMRGQLHLHA